jgi:hypothetical protein
MDNIESNNAEDLLQFIPLRVGYLKINRCAPTRGAKEQDEAFPEAIC